MVYPECDVPRGNMLQHFIKCLEELDQLVGASRSGRPEVLTEDILVNMNDYIVRSPKNSVRKFSWEIGV